MEVVGNYLVPQPEPETFSNIPVCVPTNNQNNTDGDLHVVQDPDEDPDNLEDTFDTISIILAAPTHDPTPTPEAEKKETAVQKHRRLKKKKEKENHMRTEFLIGQISRGAPYTVPPPLQKKQFQCDQCAFSSPSEHGLKVHTGKAHNSTPAKSANAIRCKRYRKNNKIKKQNAVENLKSLEERNIMLKAKEGQLWIMVEQQRRML